MLAAGHSSAVKRQVLWLCYLVVLLAITYFGGFVFPGRSISEQFRMPLAFVISLLLAYAWVRFCVLIWRPLYHGEVSPGWCLALLAAGFSIFFQLQRALFIWQHVQGL